MTEQDSPNCRNLVGTFGFIVFIALYGLIIAELSTHVEDVNKILEMIFYVFAGLAWLWPARALLRWMLAGNKQTSEKP